MGQPASFGELLRRYREVAGLSQEGLAERAGLTAKGVGALERGERQRPYPHTVRLLATALGLSDAERAAFVASLPRREVAPPPTPSAPPAPLVPPVSPDLSVRDLPGSLTALIGRESETAVILNLLARQDVRLLTLTGPGGVGKSRLALRVAEEARERFAAGVVLVTLASLHDPALVLPGIAQALGLREGGGTGLVQAVAAALGDRRVLLVLDNFEQVADAAADVTELLLRCGGLKVLVTSRAALRVRGEQEYRVPPLGLPVGSGRWAVGGEQRGTDSRPTAHGLPPTILDSEAVRLFVARARAVQSDFALTPANAGTVAAICTRVDGLPLAIELAAARIALLPPAVLLARLERGLGVLTGGARDLPARQRTMRETIAWSYDLLAPDERALFRRLATFAGGWTMEAAEAICTEGRRGPQGEPFSILEGHAALLDHSLIARAQRGKATELGGGRDADSIADSRFGMLETIRAYGLEQLTAQGEATAVRDRHVAYFLDLALVAGAELRGPRQAGWLARLEAELPNLRAALGWTFDGGDPVAGLRLAAALDRFWQYHGHPREGRAWLERGLAVGGVPSAERARALGLAGWLARNVNDHAGATALLEESLALYRDLDQPEGLAETLDSLGDVAYFSGDLARARALHEENLALRSGLGDRWGVAMSLNSLGWVALAEGELVEATDRLAEALTLVEALGDRRGIAMILGSQGLVALDRHDGPMAEKTFVTSLRLFDELGNRIDITLSLAGLAASAGLLGWDERAARLYGAAEHQSERNDMDDLNNAFWQRHYAPHLAAARARLGAEAWAAGLAAGRALSQEAAVAEALGLAGS